MVQGIKKSMVIIKQSLRKIHTDTCKFNGAPFMFRTEADTTAAME